MKDIIDFYFGGDLLQDWLGLPRNVLKVLLVESFLPYLEKIEFSYVGK